MVLPKTVSLCWNCAADFHKSLPAPVRKTTTANERQILFGCWWWPQAFCVAAFPFCSRHKLPRPLSSKLNNSWPSESIVSGCRPRVLPNSFSVFCVDDNRCGGGVDHHLKHQHCNAAAVEDDDGVDVQQRRQRQIEDLTSLWNVLRCCWNGGAPHQIKRTRLGMVLNCGTCAYSVCTMGSPITVLLWLFGSSCGKDASWPQQDVQILCRSQLENLGDRFVQSRTVYFLQFWNFVTAVRLQFVAGKTWSDLNVTVCGLVKNTRKLKGNRFARGGLLSDVFGMVCVQTTIEMSEML